MSDVLVAIVYHSGYGHTKVLAEAVEKGAASKGVKTLLLTAEEATEKLELLDAATAIIFGSPTYMGSVSAPFTAFMDASSRIWMQRGWQDKLAAGFTNSHSLSGDKFNSLMQMVTFASQHGMIWVSLGLANESGMPGAVSGDPEKINRVGGSLGAMAQSDNAPATETPGRGDKRTAELLGERVATTAIRWMK